MKSKYVALVIMVVGIWIGIGLLVFAYFSQAAEIAYLKGEVDKIPSQEDLAMLATKEEVYELALEVQEIGNPKYFLDDRDGIVSEEGILPLMPFLDLGDDDPSGFTHEMTNYHGPFEFADRFGNHFEVSIPPNGTLFIFEDEGVVKFIECKQGTVSCIHYSSALRVPQPLTTSPIEEQGSPSGVCIVPDYKEGYTIDEAKEKDVSSVQLNNSCLPPGDS